MRPIYDLASAFAAQFLEAHEDSSRIFEAIVGVVTDNKDPQKLGRVRIQFPIFSETDSSWWAPIVMLGAGKNRGWFFIPEIHDEVLVMFEHGDINRPIVVGALWNGKDKPADKNSGGNPRRVIKSRQGSKIIFDDEKGKLVVEDGGGKGRITFDAEANKILIQALDGDVCFQSPEGEMQIVAKTAEITATDNIEIYAGGTMKWGTGKAATINGSSGVTMSGSKVIMNTSTAIAPDAMHAEPKDIPEPYEAYGASGDGGASTGGQAARSSSPSSGGGGGGGGAGAGGSAARAAGDPAPLEPQPVVVSAKWAQARLPVSTSVKLSAVCADMSGKAATFTIRDADNESTVVATLDGTCDDKGVEASWTTPSTAPPGRFVFEVAADGKQATSGMLTLVNAVEVKLMLDEEPAEGVKVRLRAEPSGEEVTAEADKEGVARFEDAPFGDYTLLLDES